jgi:Cu-Zn family superoxide dismutase
MVLRSIDVVFGNAAPFLVETVEVIAQMFFERARRTEMTKAPRAGTPQNTMQNPDRPLCCRIARREDTMPIRRWLLSVAVAGVGCLGAWSAQAQTAKAALKDVSGKDVGQVQLLQTPHGVLIKLSVKGLPAGDHAFHIHAVGKCEPPFTSAGGHFNPTGHKHGMEAADGPHAGDMPNLHIPAGGELTVEIANPMISLVKGQPNSVFDADGSAIIIHAGADDYKTDPTGNAGDRIACGVIAE